MAAAHQVPVAGLIVIVDSSLNRMTFVKSASASQLFTHYPELTYSTNPLAMSPSTAMSVYLYHLCASVPALEQAEIS